MIRAAALSYAIVFSLLIGLICSGLLFISATQKKLEIHYTGNEALLLDSYAAIQFGKNELPLDDTAQIIHPSGDTSIIKHSKWGAFSVVCTRTFKNNKLKQRVALIGKEINTDSPSLYVPGNTGELKVAGNSLIEGTVFVPNAQVERAFISTKTYSKEKLVYGNIQSSNNSLPSLATSCQNISLSSFCEHLTPIPYQFHDSTYSFFEKTTFYQEITPIIISNSLKGNLVIQSFDSIYVTAEARLEHVILNAPIVRFESGFSGSVQVIAQEKIILEKNVHLLYPSVTILNEPSTYNSTIRSHVFLDSLSSIRGGILMTSQKIDFRNMPFLNIQPESLVAGMVYNSGESQIRGSVIGSIYTQRLSAYFGGGVYDNHLIDATVTIKKLPARFCSPNWLQDVSKSHLTLIEWL